MQSSLFYHLWFIWNILLNGSHCTKSDNLNVQTSRGSVPPTLWTDGASKSSCPWLNTAPGQRALPGHVPPLDTPAQEQDPHLVSRADTSLLQSFTSLSPKPVIMKDLADPEFVSYSWDNFASPHTLLPRTVPAFTMRSSGCTPSLPWLLLVFPLPDSPSLLPVPLAGLESPLCHTDIVPPQCGQNPPWLSKALSSSPTPHQKEMSFHHNILSACYFRTVPSNCTYQQSEKTDVQMDYTHLDE